MAVLIESMTLVFENMTLEAKHPGGLYGFKKEWDNGSYCTDGTISRLSFFEEDDGFCVFMAMQDMGLAVTADYASDVAVFMHSGHLWSPCLWLETETNPFGYTVCWHTAEELGKVSVPIYFKQGGTLAKLHGLSSEDIQTRISRTGIQGKWAIFLDSNSNDFLLGPRPLCRH